MLWGKGHYPRGKKKKKGNKRGRAILESPRAEDSE